MTVEIREHFGEWRQVSEQEARLFILSHFMKRATGLDQLDHDLGGKYIRGTSVTELFRDHEDQLPVRMRGGSENRQSGLGDFL